MMADILHTNRENVLAALQRFHVQLSDLERRLQDADEASILDLLRQAAAAREHFLEVPSDGAQQ
jgi:prephenate dehydrogenase